MAEYSLRFEKDTERKHRWVSDVDGVSFKFYIPQQVTPDPPPERIDVAIETDPGRAVAIRANLKAVVRFAEEHTETVRYTPVGDPDTWQIGEPYVPKTALPTSWPRELYVAVAWD